MHLHIRENSIDSHNVLALATLLNLKLTVTALQTDKAVHKPEFAAKALLQRVPLLEVEKGKYLNSTMAIVKYLCGQSDVALLGQTDYDKVLLDQYAELIVQIDAKLPQTIEAPAPPTEKGTDKPEEPTKKSVDIQGFETFNKILKFSTFLGGNTLSFADFLLFFALEKARKALGNKPFAELNNLNRFWNFMNQSAL